MKLFKKRNNKCSFPFADTKNTATMSCIHVTNEGKPILYVSHDKDDGMWQFLCGGTHDMADAMVVSLYYIYEKDTSVAEIADLPYGSIAERETVGAAWKKRRR